MRIGEVIGGVTLNRCHPSLRGASWKIVVALNQDGLRGDESGRSEPYVVFDQLGAGDGTRIGVSEGAEASAPFYPDQKPIDGYAAALLDTIELG